MQEIKDIDITLKSEPMNEMLAQPPSWLVRSGTGLFLVFLVIVLALAWFIEYPDELTGNTTITSTTPPIELSNNLQVQVKKILVSDGQQVQKNQLLIEFDHLAKPAAIQEARKYIQTIKSGLSSQSSLLPEPVVSLALGSFQQTWSNLTQAVAEWNQRISSDLEGEQLMTIEKEIVLRERLQTISNRKIKLSESEYQLLAEELKTSEQLADKQVITKQVLTQDKRAETQAQQSVQSYKEQYVQNLIQLNALKKSRNELLFNQKQAHLLLTNKIKTTLAALETNFYEWERSSGLIAPCEGIVLFQQQLQPFQFYNPKEASLVVVPRGNLFNALGTIETAGAGKLKRGQKVILELTDYPKNEFGFVEGKVASISKIDKAGKYQVKIDLPKQLKTTFNKQLPAQAKYNGTMKILTKEKRLLERFFEKLIDLIQ
jgi:multidrug resistance efflux pump